MDYHAAFRNLNIKAILAMFVVGANAQKYLPKAGVSYSGEDVIVSASDPRPLEQAITSVSEKYGWIIDYEDPVYAIQESRDAAIPEWRKAHPTEPGLLIPSGGAFVARLTKDDTKDEASLLQSLIQQYNLSNNPGYFRLLHPMDEVFIASGRSRTQQSPVFIGVLDASFNPSPQPVIAAIALEELINQCTYNGGITITLGTIPNDAINQSVVAGYNGSISCRAGLRRILAAIPYALTYALLYDIGSRSYVLNIVPAHQAVIGIDGKSTLVPIRKPPK